MCTERAIGDKYGAEREKWANFQHNFTNETGGKWERTCRVGQNCLAVTMLGHRSVPKTKREDFTANRKRRRACAARDVNLTSRFWKVMRASRRPNMSNE